MLHLCCLGLSKLTTNKEGVSKSPHNRIQAVLGSSLVRVCCYSSKTHVFAALAGHAVFLGYSKATRQATDHDSMQFHWNV